MREIYEHINMNIKLGIHITCGETETSHGNINSNDEIYNHHMSRKWDKCTNTLIKSSISYISNVSQYIHNLKSRWMSQNTYGTTKCHKDISLDLVLDLRLDSSLMRRFFLRRIRWYPQWWLIWPTNPLWVHRYLSIHKNISDVHPMVVGHPSHLSLHLPPGLY